MNELHRYVFNVLVQVEVEAYDEDDAAAVISDCFGEGEACGLLIQNVEVLDSEELN